jgi:hypothetical protein
MNDYFLSRTMNNRENGTVYVHLLQLKRISNWWTRPPGIYILVAVVFLLQTPHRKNLAPFSVTPIFCQEWSLIFIILQNVLFMDGPLNMIR